MTSLSDICRKAMSGKRVEPQQRMVGGSYGWAIHTYPIKGGITLADVMYQNICKNNALFKRLTGKV